MIECRNGEFENRQDDSLAIEGADLNTKTLTVGGTTTFDKKHFTIVC